MFIGHFALGLAAKRAAPRLSLAVLFAAAQLADLLWPLFLWIGIEQVRIDPGNTRVTPLDFVSYPYSHSLLLLTCWALIMAVAFRRRDPRAFAVISVLAVSHWLLDFLTHRPDLPLYPGGSKFGLGLWNSVAGTVALEVPLYLAGAWIYLRFTRAKDRVGRWGLLALLATLLLIYAGNVGLAAPPPSPMAIAAVGIAGGLLFIAWSWWVDRHREPREPPARVTASARGAS